MGRPNRSMSKKRKRESCVPANCDGDNQNFSPVPLDRISNGRIQFLVDKETVEEFLQKFKPSKINVHETQVYWLQIQNPHHQHISPRLSSDVSQYYTEALDPLMIKILDQKADESDRGKCLDAILRIAKLNGSTCGKWLIFANSVDVDFCWEIIVAAVEGGNLGCSAKVATRNPDSPFSHVICVYCSNFENTAEVERVLKALLILGFNIRSGFKPDIFTGDFLASVRLIFKILYLTFLKI